jgi:uncharacterized protein YkwD
MKNILHAIIMGLLTIFSAYLYIIADTTPTKHTVVIKEEPLIHIDREENETLKYLNYLRVNSGLVPFKLNSHLKEAAKNHANYLIDNSLIGHYEDSNRTGYTGMYGSQRSIHSGYKTSMVIENISNNNYTYKESIDGLMAAIYHRFGFLDFHIDEIGIGIQQNREDRGETAFVYDMGSQNLEDVCQKKNSIKHGEYVKGICADKDIKIGLSFLNGILEKNRYRNRKVVTYPFSGQEDVPPAFFNELPDPLPNYDVSGFPVSISFNESYFEDIEMISFKLFDENREIKDVIIYDQKTDPNRRLKKSEFALFPLKRLDWNSRYRVEAIYKVDGKLDKKEWSFRTRAFKIPLYRVADNNSSFSMSKGESAIFYFPPKSKVDTLGSLKYPSYLDISFIDKNTIQLKVTGDNYGELVLDIGTYKLKLNIKDKIY